MQNKRRIAALLPCTACSFYIKKVCFYKNVPKRYEF